MAGKFYKLVILLFICNCGYSQLSDSLVFEDARNKQKFRIAAIKVEGANFTDKNVVTLISGLTEGEEITVPGDQVTEAIKKLWKQGMFEDIQILQDKIIGSDIFLIIRVVERPRLTKFGFKGDVKKSDADEIRGKIRLLKERVVTDYMIGTIKNTVKDHYLEKGYYFTKVEI